MKESNSNMLIMTTKEILEKYGDELRKEERVLLRLCGKYLDMSEEDLSDVTPFDVLNDVGKLI